MVADAARQLTGKGRLTEANIKDTLRQVRLALLEADVALPVVKTFIERIRERTDLAELAAEVTKVKRSGRSVMAVCPFHQEKTPSFHVDDRKGYYYCFGCHAKGDAISFVRETENVGFMEAVEILAREAGMQMPARDPEAQKRADRRGGLPPLDLGDVGGREARDDSIAEGRTGVVKRCVDDERILGRS